MKPSELLRIYEVRGQGVVAQFLVLLGLGFILVIVDLILPFFSKLLFDLVYRQKEFGALNTIILVMMVFYVIQFVIRNSFDFLALCTSRKISLRLKTRVFDHIQNLEMRVFHAQSQGDLIVRFTQDIDRTIDLLLNQRLDVVFQLVQLIGVSSLCIWILPRSYLVLALSISFYLLSSRYLFKTELGLVRDKLTHQKSVIIEFLQTIFRQLSVVKAFRTESFEKQRYAILETQQIALSIQDRILKLIFAVNGQLGFDLWHVFVNWYFGYGVIKGYITVGDLVALLLLFSQLKQPLLGLNQQFGRYRTGMASLNRIHQLSSLKTEYELNGGSSRLASRPNRMHPGRVVIRNLKYTYPGTSDIKRPVFDSLNLTFEPGTYVTIVGDNGAGKSTLVQLLDGTENRYKGEILIDDQELRSFRRADLRKSIVSVNRDQGIFPGTLRENIAYGNPEATEEQIIEVAKAVALWEEIEKLPVGLDTPIKSENEISQSKRQKLAIARALLVNPKILILDEVTGDFDLMSDYLIQRSIRQMTETRTVISIAQHASALKNSDRIIFLKNGNIQEEGNFSELMRNRGEFYRYYVMIYGGFPEFKRMLDHEIERSSRHHSVFSVAAFKIEKYEAFTRNLSPSQLPQLNSEILLAWIRSSRASDSVMNYGQDLYLILLPELKAEDVPQYLERKIQTMGSQSFQLGSKLFRFHFTGRALTFDNKQNRVKSAEEVLEQLLEANSISTIRGKVA